MSDCLQVCLKCLVVPVALELQVVQVVQLVQVRTSPLFLVFLVFLVFPGVPVVLEVLGAPGGLVALVGQSFCLFLCLCFYLLILAV